MTLAEVPKNILAELGINPAAERCDNCVDEDLAEDLIRGMLALSGLAKQENCEHRGGTKVQGFPPRNPGGRSRAITDEAGIDIQQPLESSMGQFSAMMAAKV